MLRACSNIGLAKLSPSLQKGGVFYLHKALMSLVLHLCIVDAYKAVYVYKAVIDVYRTLDDCGV